MKTPIPKSVPSGLSQLFHKIFYVRIRTSDRPCPRQRIISTSTTCSATTSGLSVCMLCTIFRMSICRRISFRKVTLHSGRSSRKVRMCLTGSPIYIYMMVRNRCLDHLRKKDIPTESLKPYDTYGIIEDDDAQDRSLRQVLTSSSAESSMQKTLTISSAS